MTVVVLVLALTWLVLLYGVFTRTHTNDDSADSSEVLLGRCVDDTRRLENVLDTLRKEIRNKDAIIAELHAWPPAAVVQSVPEPPAADPPFPPPPKLPHQPDRPPADQFVDKLKLRSEHASKESSSCDFQESVDYLSDGADAMVVGPHTEISCCQLCMKSPATCKVAVLGSSLDSPPFACWLKAKVGRAVVKAGVKACWPPGHEPIPASPRDVQSDQAKAHDEKLASYMELKNGDDPETLRRRGNAIRDAARHVWTNYHDKAWGQDDLLPVSGKGVETKFRHAVSMVDGLDTLWIMGLMEEFNQAKEWIATNMETRIARIHNGASLFETIIRTLGGLLSAYDFSKDDVFLTAAKLLANRVNTKVNDEGVTPYTFGGTAGAGNCPTLAESGTVQLEMRYLSRVTGDSSYMEKVNRFYETLQRHEHVDGLWPNCWKLGSGKITLGANGDSFYEYLLKVWILGGKKDDNLWRMYDSAAQGLEKHMIRNGPSGHKFVGNVFLVKSKVNRYEEEMEHLTCFVPGWLALGASHRKDGEVKKRHMQLAVDLAETCWEMYNQQPTGIAPERVKNMLFDLSTTTTREYILRPEAVEGWWYMYELTKDPKYREWGWQMFLKIEKWLWTSYGYASLKDVRRESKHYIDKMESFFLAETLKYLFLLQDPDHNIKLDRYVFNTEAHPLSIF